MEQVIKNEEYRRKADRMGIMLDLMLEALHKDRLDVYDFLEEQKKKLIAKDLKEL